MSHLLDNNFYPVGTISENGEGGELLGDPIYINCILEDQSQSRN